VSGRYHDLRESCREGVGLVWSDRNLQRPGSASARTGNVRAEMAEELMGVN
jgi:hypothetical protein